MADVGLGQLITTTGRFRSKVLKDAVTDNHPVMKAMDIEGGIIRADGGRTIVDEGMTAQNSSVAWVGESGNVPLTDTKVIDASEFDWKYLLGAVVWTLAERYRNSGGSDTKIIDVVSGKFKVLEATMMNAFNEGMLSSGTGTGGLQLNGLASLVSTTPTTGTVGGIDRSLTNAIWFRNQKFDTAADWSDGAVDSGNVKRFLDKGINATTRNGQSQLDLFLMGDTHFGFLTSALQAQQQIVNESGTGKSGFQKMVYRGIPVYLGGGVTYSSYTATVTATRTYGLNVKPGGVNLVYHEKAEFDMLEPVNSSDQAAISRLMFTMAGMRIGALAKLNWVGFD